MFCLTPDGIPFPQTLLRPLKILLESSSVRRFLILGS